MTDERVRWIGLSAVAVVIASAVPISVVLDRPMSESYLTAVMSIVSLLSGGALALMKPGGK